MSSMIPKPVGPDPLSLDEAARFVRDETGDFVLFYCSRSKVGGSLDLRRRPLMWVLISPGEFTDFIAAVHVVGAVLGRSDAHRAWYAACFPGWLGAEGAN